MKKQLSDFRVILCLLLFWRMLLWLTEVFIAPRIPIRSGFLGPIPWANFDGVHYLSIARAGYRQYLEAFFPLYPLIIRLGLVIPGFLWQTAVIVSHGAFLVGLWLYVKLLRLGKENSGWWQVVLLLFFPTSFAFASVYSESLYFLFAVACVYAAKKRNWLVSGVLAALASATRVFGIFLWLYLLVAYAADKKRKQHRISDLLGMAIAPAGLLLFMWFLWVTRGDPFAFFHVQPAFGAERSGSTIVFLPQVLWRYGKIFLTASAGTLSYYVAWFEFVCFTGGILLVWLGWKKKHDRPLLLYTAAVLLVPSMTGTLSSMPRYVLSAFPLFMLLGNLHNTKIKLALVCLFMLGLIATTSLFLRGYFIS